MVEGTRYGGEVKIFWCEYIKKPVDIESTGFLKDLVKSI
jgi:hypothetical protein